MSSTPIIFSDQQRARMNAGNDNEFDIEYDDQNPGIGADKH
jgi:hypothetical protein